MDVRDDERLAQHLDHGDRRADRRLEAELHTGLGRRREELGAAAREQLLVRGHDRLAGAKQLQDVVAGRLEAAHHLGDDRDRGVVADRSEVGRQHAVVRLELALLVDVPHERAHEPEPVPGRALDVVSAVGQQPRYCAADRPVPEQGNRNVNRHSAPRRLLPRHQRPELETDLLDLPLACSGPQLFEVVLAGVHLRDPLARERPVLDLGEHLAHLAAHVVVDDAVPAREVAVLGRVGDRPAHVREAALPDQVDDQLQLVQALVVGDLGLVARLDERLEAGADQLGRAAAEHRLLAEEVRLGLLREGRLDHPRATGADARSRRRARARAPGRSRPARPRRLPACRGPR